MYIVVLYVQNLKEWSAIGKRNHYIYILLLDCLNGSFF